jgi:hypothetical protein
MENKVLGGTLVICANYRVRGRIKQNGVRYLFLNAGGALGVACAIDLATGTNTLAGTVNTSLAIDGYVDFYFDGISGLAANTFYLQAQQSLATGDQTYVGDGVSGFQIDKLDIRLTADANLAMPQYQSVTSAANYDTLGFPAYLLFDGATKWMQSASAIDMSAVNKATFVYAATKLSDANNDLDMTNKWMGSKCGLFF